MRTPEISTRLLSSLPQATRLREAHRRPLEESPDTRGQGRSVTPTRGNPRESATETTPPMARPHVSREQARLKWCGKSAPPSRRRDVAEASPARCKAKQDLRPGPARSRWAAGRQRPAKASAAARWMTAHDKIRLTGLLRKSPASAGLFYGPFRWGIVTLRFRTGDLRRSQWNRSARAPGYRPRACRRRFAPRQRSYQRAETIARPR